MSYKLILTTESHLLAGSGEGGVMIDADVIFHPTGFPMIPARRIKGMLKESLEEVMEITGKSENEIENIKSDLFGDPGKSTYLGKLLFHNLMLPDWSSIVKEISTLKDLPCFQPDFIKEYFTEEIQQTAIGRENQEDEIEGVAKKRSLRNYRVVKPNVTFKGIIETTKPLSELEEQLLKKAVLNLRYAGTRRNRGFGKVKCAVESHTMELNIRHEISETAVNKLTVTVTTQSPVILADKLGEQNTVFTRKHISGNQIRGLLANAFVRRKSIIENMGHLDSDFFDLFLSGNVYFGNAIYKKARPIPLHLHRYKTQVDKLVFSVFSKTDYEISKSEGRIGIISGNEIQTEDLSPQTTFNFHNSRPNRAAGRSTENDTDTGIFYYESLNEGQAFEGEITGDASVLAKLTEVLAREFPARLGRSRSAQYGSVRVTLKPVENTDNVPSKNADGYFVMTLQSPMVLLNENGFSEPTVAVLQKKLLAAFGFTIEIEKVAAAYTTIEHFNAIWMAKSDKVPAYKEGSSFLMQLSNIESLPNQIGEWADQGFGRVIFEPYKPEEKYIVNNDKENMEHYKSGASTLSEPTDISSELLTKIRESYKREEARVIVKSKAIKNAEAKRLNNHLTGRLERLFERSDSAQKIFDWIKETQGKPAGDALKKADLVDFDHKFDIKHNGNAGEDWELQKVYWITFFQTLRKKNKADGK